MRGISTQPDWLLRLFPFGRRISDVGRLHDLLCEGCRPHFVDEDTAANVMRSGWRMLREQTRNPFWRKYLNFLIVGSYSAVDGLSSIGVLHFWHETDIPWTRAPEDLRALFVSIWKWMGHVYPEAVR